MPNLESLSLADFKEMQRNLDALGRAGEILEAAGMMPLFRLMPGEDMGLTVCSGMPSLCAAHEALFGDPLPNDPTPPARDDAPYAWSPETGVVPIGRPLAADPPPPYPPRPTPSPSPEPADDAPPAAAASGAGGVAPEPEETEEVPPAGEDPAGEPAGPQPEQTAVSAGDGPAAGGEGADLAATPPAATRPNAWTDGQDDQLIEGVALALLAGKSFTAAAHSMADPLGRTKQATWFRAHTKLRDRIEARLADFEPPSTPPPCRPAGRRSQSTAALPGRYAADARLVCGQGCGSAAPGDRRHGPRGHRGGNGPARRRCARPLRPADRPSQDRGGRAQQLAPALHPRRGPGRAGSPAAAGGGMI